MKYEIIFEDAAAKSVSAKNIYEAFLKTKDSNIDFMSVKYFRPAKIYRILKINSVRRKDIANFSELSHLI
ncbi:hypothetical protein [Fenollaria sporofastidiosus]|uniref:hypothetical protein n=1 Tax=Fenollaria sporofastidiosus TaxID=2811778 RepID=UPI001C0004BC|nr:hypothetical protein [Fenollaria sporofastidiosus]